MLAGNKLIIININQVITMKKILLMTFVAFTKDAKKAIEVAIELKYSQCLQQFLNYKHSYENQNNHVI